MIFNTSSCDCVVIWIPKQNLHYFPSYMARNISCNTLMKLSCIKERKISNQMRSHINFSSSHVVQRSTEPNNTPIIFTHTATRITQEIFLTSALSPQQLTFSMAPPYTGVTIINKRHHKIVTMQKNSELYRCIIS